jgi:hypothetical protein
MKITAPSATRTLPPYTDINPWEKPGQHLDSKDTYLTYPNGLKLAFPGTVDITKVSEQGAEWDEHAFTIAGPYTAHVSMLHVPGTDTYRLTHTGTLGSQVLNYAADYSIVEARRGYAELVPIGFEAPGGRHSFFKFAPTERGFSVESELDLPFDGAHLHRNGTYE